MAGALGCLGVILEVSLRVTPAPRQRDGAGAGDRLARPRAPGSRELMRRPTPAQRRVPRRRAAASAALRRRGRRRRAGGASWAARPSRSASGTPCATYAHPALAGEAPLWRLSLPQTAPIPAVGDVVGLGLGRSAGLAAFGRSRPRRSGDARPRRAAMRRCSAAPRPGDEVFQPLAPRDAGAAPAAEGGARPGRGAQSRPHVRSALRMRAPGRRTARRYHRRRPGRGGDRAPASTAACATPSAPPSSSPATSSMGRAGAST